MPNQRVWIDMLIPFDQMPDNARLWIYQADRKLKPEEVRFVEENTNNFLNQLQLLAKLYR